MKKQINLTIDGRNVHVDEGLTIFQAAKSLGIDIPHLCYHPSLPANGACRLCVVKVEGGRSLVSSCTTPVAPGMVIRTESEEVVEARRIIIDLLLSSHPVDCLTCEKTGDCKLQDYAYRYGVKRTSFIPLASEYSVDDSNPFIERDHSKCILCGRCISTCAVRVGNHVYSNGYRGFNMKVIAGLDKDLQDSPCVFCGNCITNCPTGALTAKQSKGQGRRYEMDQIETVCAYCGVGCSLQYQVKNGVIAGAWPANGPANENLLCVKGRFGWDYIQSPERLTVPLIRKEGQLVESTWEEALSYTAGKLLEIRDKHGANALAAMASAKCSNEENYLLQKLFRLLGTNNIDNSARLCHASTIAGLAEAFGSGAATNSLAELDSAEVFFIIGSNTSESHPVVSYRIRQAQQNGATVIVADPRQTEISEKADLWIRHLPGTDVALLNGMLHVIVKEELYDREFIDNRTEGFAEVMRIVDKYNPSYVEAITGVPAADIEKAARIYARSGHSVILYAMGITQHTTGTDNVRAIANLALATGNIGRASTGVFPLRGQNNVQGACDMGGLPAYFPGYQKADSESVRLKFEEAWGCELSGDTGMTIMDMIDEAAAGNLKALYVMGENPMMSNPDLSAVKKGLSKLELLVVQDIFLTETAQLADVVLPGTTAAEKEGTFTNTERRVQLLRRVIAPLGQSLPDWEIICRLAQVMGVPMRYDSPAQIMEEIAALTPSYGGMLYDRLEGKGLQWPCLDKNHPGTAFLHKDKFARGLGRFGAVEYKDPAELPDDDYPYLLVTGRNLYQYHTGSMSRRSKGLESAKPEAYAEISPAAAGGLGICDGEYVILKSRRGEIRIKTEITERVSDKIIFVPFHYSEAAANLLTNPVVDAVAGIPEFKVSAVKVEKVKAEIA
jgi:formate dehydrogenase alpha subunit